MYSRKSSQDQIEDKADAQDPYEEEGLEDTLQQLSNKAKTHIKDIRK